ncbi:MAG: hypothetical protein B6241_00320 [Spirochaetaceae bacterium 4572_59]|nr:MAG: hypothetical protein B6241_00320 [Spirochaetaceae bacterium 4572_59]
MKPSPVRSILRREIRSFFNSPTAYMVIFVFLILEGWLFVSPFFLAGRADMRDFFSLLPLILAILIPALTMGLYSGELSSGHDEILGTLPLSSRQILWGKFLAVTAFTGILLLPTLSYGFFISATGDLDWGPVLGGYAGALLLGSTYSAVGLLCSSLTKRQVVAFLLSSGICLFSALLDDLLLFIPGRFRGFLTLFSIGSHFQSFTGGLIDLRDLLYFLSIDAICLMLLAKSTFRQQGWRSLRRVQVLLSCILILMLNRIAGDLPLRMDLTSNQIHTISDVSRQILQELEEPVSIGIYLSENLPQPYDNLEKSLGDLMKSYSLVGNRHFRYRIHMISGGGDEDIKMAEGYGIQAFPIQDIDNDEVKLVNAWMGLVIIQGDRQQILPILDPKSNLEYKISSALLKLTRQSGQLLNLEEDISISLTLSSSLLNRFEELKSYPLLLQKSIEEINPQYYGKLEFNSLTTKDTSLRAVLTINGNGRSYEKTLLKDSREGLQIYSPQDMLSLIEDAVPLLLGSAGSLGYLTSHGTKALYGQGGLNNFSRLVSENYEIRPLSLKDALPENLSLLLIAGAVDPFSPSELARLKDFLDGGGSLALFHDSYREIIPSQEEISNGKLPEYIPDRTGLKGLLKSYGLTLETAYVLDTHCFIEQLQEDDGSLTEIPIYYAPEIDKNGINRNYPAMGNLNGLIALNSSPVRSESEGSFYRITTLFSSSGSSWLMDKDINLYNPLAIFPPEEEARNSFPLAAVSENLKSGGRIFLAGSSSYLEDILIDQQGETPNAMLVLNILDVLDDRPEMALLRSKGQSYNPLEPTTQARRNRIKVFNMALLPLLAVLMGIPIYFRYRKRQNRIQEFFMNEQKL